MRRFSATQMVSTFLLLASMAANANYVTVYGPQKFFSGLLSAKTYSADFKASGDVDGSLIVTNGNGADLSPKTCSGSLLKVIACKLDNLGMEVLAAFERPSNLEIVINNQILVTKTNLPQTQGKIVIPIRVKANNTMKVKVGVSPFAFVSVEVKADNTLPNALPLAKMSASDLYGYNPLFVTFSAAMSSDSDGTIISYDWDFADGTIGNGMFITHTFSQTGQYPVKLTVTDNRGGKASTAMLITVLHNDPPLAKFTATTTTDLGNLDASFDASASSDPDGSIVAYDWDLGDGTTLSGVSIQHRYAQPGVYQVKLTVKDNIGFTNSIQQNVEVKDTQAPILAIFLPAQDKQIYTNSLPYSLQVNGSSNEFLSEVKVGTATISTINNGLGFDGFVSINATGATDVTVTAKDRWGNIGSASSSIALIFDNVAPLVTIGAVPSVTKESNIPVSITVQDQSPTTTQVLINGALVTSVSDKVFTYSFPLSVEGENIIEVKAVDAAGNVSTIASKKVVKDTIAPLLSDLIPQNAASFDRIAFTASGKSDEPLQSASVNGMALTLAADKKSFTGTYIGAGNGEESLNWKAVDLAGNESNVSSIVTIQPRLLIPELLSIVPDADNRHMYVIGAIGATRPSSDVSATTGLLSFNRGSAVSSADGSFSIRLDNFSSVKVTVSKGGAEESATLIFNSATHLSGIVKDTQGNPLPGATVRLLGYTKSVVTDASGVFSFQAPATGDQTLSIDGSTIPQSITGENRAFSTTNVFINIGIGQTNVLPRPIYLAPLLLDGSQTVVAANSPATVESAAAPGVTLEIPPNVTNFPNGSNQGTINIASIQSEMSTIQVPSSAVPTKVLALEPSGLKFSQRVPLTLPNDNELPAGTEMLILSMNSTTGKWEIDGSAAVSSDGSSVKTKPGEGISHFSLVYAVPLKPFIMEIADPKVSGIDISKDAMTTRLQLPSFKSLGLDSNQSLTYNSSWAHPTAYVSNSFDFGSAESIVTYKSSSTGSKVERVEFRPCAIDFWGVKAVCWNDYKNFYHEWTVSEDVKVETRVRPESIKTQFFVGGISSENIEFTPGSNDEESQLPGVTFKGSLSSEITEKTGLPAHSYITYAVPLKNKGSEEFLASGIYPTLARYQIRLKSMVITTGTSGVQYKVDGSIVPEASSNNKIDRTDTVVQDISPSDLVSSVIVQNKVKSPYGRGWDINSTQRIMNKSGNRIVIEEAGGGVSTYGLKNSISTIFDGNNSEYNLNAADLSHYPKAVVSRTTASKDNYLMELDLSSSSSTPVNLGLIATMTGRIANQAYYVCPAGYNSGSFTPTFHDFKETVNPGGIVRTADGAVLVSSLVTHSLMKNQNGSSVKLGGIENTVAPSLLYGAVFNGTRASIDQFCSANYGSNCATPVNSTTLACTKVRDFCPAGNICTKQPNFIASVGNMPMANYSGDGFTGALGSPWNLVGFNSPMAMAVDSSGLVVLADSGNNAIRKMDLSTGTVATIAGTGGNQDIGDGNQATSAGIYHPRGVAYDSMGNLYISSEAGYIRKVDPSGVISTFAGLPPAKGGIVSEEAPADKIAFNKPYGMVYDSDNNLLYVADTGSHRVFKIDLATMIATNVAGNGQCLANADDNVPAVSSSICSPSYVGLDENKNLVVLDSGHKRIRKINFSYSGSGSLVFAPTSKDLSTLVRNDDATWTRTYRDGTKVSFNQQGLQEKIVDRAGRTTNFSYNLDRTIASIQDPVGQTLNYSYSGGKLNTITDPAGRTTNFRYSGDLLTEVTMPDGQIVRYEYDDRGLLTSEKKGNGGKTSYAYNDYLRLTTVTDALGNANQIADQQSAAMSNGGTSVLTSAGVGDDAVNTKLTDAKGTETKLLQDGSGYLTKIVDAKGNVTLIDRDFDGKPIKVVRPDHTEIKFSYDANTGDMLRKDDLYFGTHEVTTYDSWGKATQFIDSKGLVYKKQYNSLGLMTADISPDNTSTSYTYNSFGLPLTRTTMTSASTSIVSTFAYDSKGNLTKVSDSGGRVKEFTYDLAGNILTSKEGTGTTAKITQFEYDLGNRLLKVINGKGEVTQYSYYQTGALASIIDPRGKVSSFEYDARGQLITKTDSSGGQYHLAYDVTGNPISQLDPRGALKKFNYDVLNQLVAVEYPDDLVQFEYDSAGYMIKASNNVSQTVLQRDPAGRVLSETVAGIGALAAYPTQTIASGYDANGNRVSASNSAETFSYEYDGLDRVTKIQNSWGDSFSFGYDKANRLASVSRPGSSSLITFNQSGLVDSIKHYKGSTMKTYSEYTYNTAGQVTQKRSPAGNIDNVYDPSGQLISSTNGAGVSEAFTYDQNGNRTSDSNGSYQYDITNDRLAEDWQYRYSYDLNGNLIQKIPKDAAKKSYQYIYASNNRLIQVRELESALGQIDKQIDFAYDALGRRIKKSVWTRDAQVDPKKTFNKYYVYNGSNIFLEYGGDGSLLARYTHSPLTEDDVLSVAVTASGVSAGVATSAGTYYYLKDSMGSISEIVSATGDIVQRYEYSAFGQITSIKDGSGNNISANPYLTTNFAFTGREWDQEASMYYQRARYYDPSIGRFLQTDPDPGSAALPTTVTNKYGYAGNNPFSYRDSTGRDFWQEFIKVVVVVVAVVAAVYAGAAAAAYLGLSGVAGAIVGAAVGAAVGGIVAGVGWTAFGLGRFDEGFKIGAIAGAIAGGIAGYGAFDLGVDFKSLGQYKNAVTKKAIAEWVEPLRSAGISFNYDLVPMLQFLEKIIVGVAAGAYLGYNAYAIDQGQYVEIPKGTIFTW